MADQESTTIPERLGALEVHLDYTVKGIDELKAMMADHVSHPCQLCSLADEVAINANDIVWLKRIGYTLCGSCLAGLITFGVNRVTGVLDKIITIF